VPPCGKSLAWYGVSPGEVLPGGKLPPSAGKDACRYMALLPRSLGRDFKNVLSAYHRHFISTGLQPGAGSVRAKQPFQRLFSPRRKPLKRLKRFGRCPSPG
jgi:hypothetical protein